jgi:integrase
LASTSTRDGQPFKAHPQGWLMYATWLVSDGVPINVVSRLMGHEQISTTLNRYTHATGSDHR